MPARRRIAIVMLTLSMSGIAFVSAQDAPPRQSWSSMLNIDALIDNYSRQLARKYTLTDEQDTYTQELLRLKSQAFLANHRERLFALIDRMFEVRGGAEISQQEMIDWGRQAMPMFEDAKRIIVEGNSEWRQILTDEQRKIHDSDLQLMNDSFAMTQEQLNRMVSGQMTVDEFRRGPKAPDARPHSRPPVSVEPPAPAAPAPGAATPSAAPPMPKPATAAPAAANPPSDAGASAAEERLRKIRAAQGQNAKGGSTATPSPTAASRQPSSPSKTGTASPASPAPSNPARGGRHHGVAAPGQAGTDFESQWEAYVREFIQRYKLDDDQTQRAQAILKDCQEQARNYMGKRKSTIEDLEKRIAEANAANKPKEAKEAQDRKAKLLEPIGQIFEKQLKPKLDRLPTRAQRQAAIQTGGRPSGKPGSATPPAKPGTPAVNPPPQPQPQQPPTPQPPPQPEPQPQPVPQPEPTPQPEEPGEPVPQEVPPAPSPDGL